VLLGLIRKGRQKVGAVQALGFSLELGHEGLNSTSIEG
jgi:hypothetical protein